MSGAASAPARVPGRVVIVGAGQAGGRCAEALRRAGFAGPLTLVGRETHPPYERPSLSKEMLLAGGDEPISWVRPAEAYADDSIDLRLGTGVVAIDRERREVGLADGARLPYDALVLATGARARLLAAPGAVGVPMHVIRTVDDSRALRDRLRPGLRVAIVGAGFIGLEIAAACRKRDAHVTVVEAAPRVMARATPPEIGAFYAALHRSHGVDLRLGTGVRALRREGEAAAIETSDGGMVVADLLVVGIGIEPNDELAREAGLPTDRGVVVDQWGRTTDPRIYAAGDVARHFNPIFGRHILLESWQNAQNQAIAVARVISGGSEPYAELPWFWTDQFGVNLQVVGLPDAEARTVLRGTPDTGPFVLLEVEDGRVRAACAVDAPRELRYARELITAAVPFDEARLADPAIRLADLVKEAKSRTPAAPRP